jgi:uncharacterized protein DUF4375
MRRAAALLALLAVAGCGDREREAARPALDPDAPDVLVDRFDVVARDFDWDAPEEAAARLPPGDRALVILFAVDGEVGNGGYEQYLFNSTADLHELARASAVEIGAQRMVGQLDALLEILELEQMPDQEERNRLVLRLSDAQAAAIEELDEEFYGAGGVSLEVDERLRAYMREHPEAFGG